MRVSMRFELNDYLSIYFTNKRNVDTSIQDLIERSYENKNGSGSQPNLNGLNVLHMCISSLRKHTCKGSTRLDFRARFTAGLAI